MSTRNTIFETYGDDPRAALDAWLNVDPEDFHRWSDKAEERQYRTEYRRWIRGKTMKVEALDRKNIGQARLFDPPTAARGVEVRQFVVLDGEVTALDTVAGLEGAAALERSALRDLAPAETTAKRCRYELALAAHLRAETERLGRPVTVAEVIGLRRAS